uniref:MCE family protein n=1 Tax=candidate division WOR-3 bacterium TaxID=2052148 RepID=A0A7C6E9I8_UNCW3
MNRQLKGFAITLFVILSIGIFILMVSWFSGLLEVGPRRASNTYHIYFDNVSGLKIGDPVEVLGVIKGRVKKMRLEDNRVMVTVALSSEIKLTKGAKFAIRSQSYIGSDKYLFVNPGVGEPVSPNFIFNGENESLNLEVTFSKIDNLIDNLMALKLGTELIKTKDELLQAVQSLRESFKPFGTSVSELTFVLEGISVKFDSLTDLLTQESTIKELLSSKELYNELLTTNRQLQDLIKDIKTNPQKYIQLRLFK